MSRTNLKMSIVLTEMIQKGLSIGTEEREPGEDRIAGYVMVMIGADATLRVGLPLLRLLELKGVASKLTSFQCRESAEEVWERMEGLGIAWQIFTQILPDEQTLVSVIFMTGDKLCAEVKQCLEAALVIPQTAMKGADE